MKTIREERPRPRLVRAAASLRCLTRTPSTRALLRASEEFESLAANNSGSFRMVRPTLSSSSLQSRGSAASGVPGRLALSRTSSSSSNGSNASSRARMLLASKGWECFSARDLCESTSVNMSAEPSQFSTTSLRRNKSPSSFFSEEYHGHEGNEDETTNREYDDEYEVGCDYSDDDDDEEEEESDSTVCSFSSGNSVSSSSSSCSHDDNHQKENHGTISSTPLFSSTNSDKEAALSPAAAQ